MAADLERKRRIQKSRGSLDGGVRRAIASPASGDRSFVTGFCPPWAVENVSSPLACVEAALPVSRPISSAA